MSVGIIAVLGSPRQNECFWPTYRAKNAGIDHDLIVVNRGMTGVPTSAASQSGETIFEDKMRIFNGTELPHKAFGAYRYFGLKYSDKYEYLAFISDDVLFQTECWLKDAVEMLSRFDKLGAVGTQIFNGNHNEYPHPSHVRAPIWFAKTSVLKKLKWDFYSDHDGEMELAPTLIRAGYFAAQVGNKIDVAYDALEAGQFGVGDHISSILAKKFSWEPSKRNEINEYLIQKLLNNDDTEFVTSPYNHIGRRNVVSQIQPFNGLVIDTGLGLADGCYNSFGFNINILKGYLD